MTQEELRKLYNQRLVKGNTHQSELFITISKRKSRTISTIFRELKSLSYR